MLESGLFIHKVSQVQHPFVVEENSLCLLLITFTDLYFGS